MNMLGTMREEEKFKLNERHYACTHHPTIQNNNQALTLTSTQEKEKSALVIQSKFITQSCINKKSKHQTSIASESPGIALMSPPITLRVKSNFFCNDKA